MVIMTLATGLQTMVAGLATGTRYRPSPRVRRVLIGVLIHRLQWWELLGERGLLAKSVGTPGKL